MARMAFPDDRDTSALMEIVLVRPEADVCAAALEAEDRLLISAGTVAEVSIVARRRNVAEEVARLVDGLGFEIVRVTQASARRIAEAYENGGRAFTRRS